MPRKWRLEYILPVIGFLLGGCNTPAYAAMLTYSSGTGFFVSRADGYVVTNNHVISHCGAVMLSGAVPASSARIIARDAEYDLALLKTNAIAPDEARIASAKQPLRAHDAVVVVGYPGQAWQTGEVKTRASHVVSTTGPRGEERWLEFDDALALGNSGGPLLDVSANVVGVVAAKGKMVRYNVDSARNEVVDSFDIAISLPVLRRFLAQNNVRFREADSGILLSEAAITDTARRFVVNVRCEMK